MENLSESTKGNNANTLLAVGISECLPNKHKRRDNIFGVTWCVKCGQLFTKPSGVPLQESDTVVRIHHFRQMLQNNKNT